MRLKGSPRCIGGGLLFCSSSAHHEALWLEKSFKIIKMFPSPLFPPIFYLPQRLHVALLQTRCNPPPAKGNHMERRLSLDLSPSGLFPPTLVPHLKASGFVVAALRSFFSVVGHCWTCWAEAPNRISENVEFRSKFHCDTKGKWRRERVMCPLLKGA